MVSLALAVGGSGGADAAPTALLGKTYSSTAVTGSPIPGGGPLVVSFPDVGHISLSAGCNRHLGVVEYSGSTLRISMLASTRMACPGARAGADDWVATFTRAPLNWYAVGHALVLSGPTNQVLLARSAM